MFNRLSRRRVVRPNVVARDVVAPLEVLETRRLFAVAVGGGSATIDESTPRLDVEGTRRADQINVDLNAGTGNIDVTINGQLAGSFSPAQVPAGIRIDGGRGNDTIVVGQAITLPVEIRGDKGNDQITGGGGDDNIDGGAGRDNCAGGDGRDSITGGAGNDVITGGGGADHVDGGHGNDDCSGDDGPDTVAGGLGRDRLAGAVGDDRLRGGGGRDDCDGGDGDDDIDGGSGRDRVRGGGGSDDFNEPADDGRRGRGRGSDDVEDRDGDDRGDGEHIPPDLAPALVITAFNALFPGATIREVEREQEDEGPVIKIDFFLNGRRMRAEFTEAGQLIEQEIRD